MTSTDPHTYDGTVYECCGSCLQPLESMTDPRELPCSHIFCLLCIKDDPKRTLTHVECIVCEVNHPVCSIEKLKLVNYSPPTGESTALDVQIAVPPCDICRMKKKKAFKFCVDCGKCLCAEHYEVHSDLLQHHVTVNISTYLNQPRKFEPRKCPKHPQRNLVLICDGCRRLYCELCDDMRYRCGQGIDDPDSATDEVISSLMAIDIGNSPGNNEEDIEDIRLMMMIDLDIPCVEDLERQSPLIEPCHTIQPLGSLVRRYKTALGELTYSISEQLREFSKAEKESWKEIEKMEAKAEELYSEINTHLHVKVAELTSQSQKLKLQIDEYVRSCVRKTEAHVASLMNKRDTLTNIWNKTNSFLLESHDVDVAREYDVYVSAVKSLQDITPSNLKIREMRLEGKESSSDFGKEFIIDAPILKCESSLYPWPSKDDLDPNCIFNVQWLPNGEIMYSSDEGIHLWKDEYLQPRITLDGPSVSARYLTDDIYGVLCGEEDDYEVYYGEIANLDAQNLCTVHSPAYNLMELPLSSSNTLFVCMSQDPNPYLKFFRLPSLEFVKDWPIPETSGQQGLKLLADNTVLITDQEKGILYKFDPFDEDLKLPIWRCEGLEEPYGIDVDDSGMIFVTSPCHSVIFMINQNGSFVDEIDVEGIDQVYDIAINEEKVALACGIYGVRVYSMI